MKRIYRNTRNVLSKLKFEAGMNPKIIGKKDFRKYIPKKYKGVVLLYADFELAWAWRYSRDFAGKKDKILKIALRERKNIPEILKLCEEFNIPITWATVGHLFLESCEKINGHVHQDIQRNNYFENEYWIYDKGDWFDDDPCGNYKSNPEWYSPDLIENILNSNVKHEIGCHTFSHIDCRDGICKPEVLISELNECRKLAKKKNILLESFVHPGHTIGNLDLLYKSGFKSYRTDDGNILGYPYRHSSGLWELKGTMELTYRKKWSVDYNKKFYSKIIDRTIENNAVCVFWFHPSFDKVFLKDIFPDVLSNLKSNSGNLWVPTAGEYINWLNKNEI